MNVDLSILYLLLRSAALQRRLITYTALSDQYEQRTGDRVDPHLGWNWPLAQIDFRCAGLCLSGHRPMLSALVIADPEGDSAQAGRPGPGFWGLHNPGGLLLTPLQPSDDAWAQMCGAVYQQEWPAALAGLPLA